MRKFLAGLGALAAAFGLTAPAQAATIVFDIPAGTFSSMPVRCPGGVNVCPGPFSATGSFAQPAGASKAKINLSTSALNLAGIVSPGFDVDLLSATFNGTPLALTSSVGDVYEFGSLGFVDLSAVNTLAIDGLAGGDSLVTGDLTFASAVPEPATWALMLMGFAGVGLVARRRRSTAAPARSQMA